MNIPRELASTSTLLLVCLGGGVLSLGFGSCGNVSISSSGGETVPDGSVADGSAADAGGTRDVATAVDSSSGFDGGALDAALDTGTAGPDGGDEAGLCGEPRTMLGTMCDGCIATNCDPTWCACAAGSADAGDAGDAGSGCLQYVSCVEQCVEGDGGSPTDCLTTVCALNPPFTPPEQQAGHAFLDCLVQYCGSECGQ